jgi:hypothetical protein
MVQADVYSTSHHTPVLMGWQDPSAYPELRLLNPLENLVQGRFLSGDCVPRLDLVSAGVMPIRTVLMGGSPDIPHLHIPGAITELADLIDLHPVSAVPYGDFIVRTDLEAVLHTPATIFSF